MSQERDVLARSCPNCGARLEATPPGRTIICRYCGQSFQPPPEVNPPPRIIVVGPGVPRPVVQGRPGAGSSAIRIAFSLLIVGALLAFSSIRAKRALVNGLSSVPSLPSDIAAAVSAAATPFMWDTVAGPPMPAAVGGGGGEGFVGRVRMRGEDTLWIAAFEGAHLGVVWKVGPFGTYSEGYQSTYASVVGKSVVVTDYRANLHVYDVASGHETRTIKLTDRAKAMCGSPDGKARVWVEMSDEKNVLVDADAGTATLSPRPAWCPNLWAASHDCRGWLKRGPPRLSCKGPEGAP